MKSIAALRRVFGFLSIGLVLAVPSAFAQADHGEVDGALIMNGKSVKLAYGYVQMDGEECLISLTDAPAEYRKLDSLWTRDDVNYVQLRFQANGESWGQDIKHFEKDGVISGGGSQIVDFETFGPEVFAGRAYLPEEQEFFGDTYIYDVTFSVRLQTLEDLGGELLPADGGPAGKAFLAWNAACLEGDAEGLKKLAPPEMAAELDTEEGKMALEFLQLMAPTEVKVTGGTRFGDEAVLEVEGLMDGERGRGEITMVNFGDKWIQKSSKWDASAFDNEESAEDELETEPEEESEDPQQLTVNAIRDLANGVMAFAVDDDMGLYPPATDGWMDASTLAGVLTLYLREVQANDGWGKPLLFWCNESRRNFRIVSRGPDGEMDHDWIEQEASNDTSGDDIVYGDGIFMKYPTGP